MKRVNLSMFLAISFVLIQTVLFAGVSRSEFPDRPITLIAVKFDLAGHVKRMMVRNPGWSDRQARCVLYWQAGVNKQLRQEASRFIYHADGSRDMVYTTRPEAMGVNVIATAPHCDIPVQVQPKDTVYKIALVGYAPGVTPARRAS